MTNSIDNAAARLCDIAQAMTSIVIKSAPDYPVENVEPCPFVAAYALKGRLQGMNKTSLQNFPIIAVEFHLSRVNIKQMQQQINAIVYEFPQRLAGDPTLNGTVDTILFGTDSPIEYSAAPFEWAQVATQRVLFPVPVKLLVSPVATP